MSYKMSENPPVSTRKKSPSLRATIMTMKVGDKLVFPIERLMSVKQYIWQSKLIDGKAFTTSSNAINRTVSVERTQ